MLLLFNESLNFSLKKIISGDNKTDNFMEKHAQVFSIVVMCIERMLKQTPKYACVCLFRNKVHRNVRQCMSKDGARINEVRTTENINLLRTILNRLYYFQHTNLRHIRNGHALRS